MRRTIVASAVVAVMGSVVACVSDDSVGPSNDDAGSIAEGDGGSPPQPDATIDDAGNDASGDAADGATQPGTDGGVDASDAADTGTDASTPSSAIGTGDAGNVDAGFPQMNLLEEVTTGTVTNQQGEAVAALPGGGFIWGAQYQVAIGGTFDFPNWPASGWNSKGAYDILIASLNGLPSMWWGQSFGSTGIDDQDLNIKGTLAVMPNGNILFTGSHVGTFGAVGGTALPSNGNYDVFLARIANAPASGPSGQAVSFGGTDEDGAQTIAVSADGKWVAVGGYFGSSTMNVPGIASALTHAVDSTDGAVLGYPDNADAWVAVGSTALGTFTYAAAFGAGGVDDEVTALAFDANDNLYVGGFVSAAVTFPGGASPTAEGQKDGFVLQLAFSDPDGGAGPSWSPGWSKSIATDGNDDVQGLAMDPSNHVWVTGMYGDTLQLAGNTLPASSQGTTGYLVSYDTTGTALFASGGAGNGQILPYGMAIDTAAGVGNGDVYVIGLLGGQATWGGPALVGIGSPNSALLRFSSAGTLLSQRAFVATGSAVYESVAVDSTHTVAVAGYIEQATNFGDGVTSAYFGGWDAFYALYHF